MSVLFYFIDAEILIKHCCTSNSIVVAEIRLVYKSDQN